MSKHAPSPVAICPFYKDTEKQRVHCEGLEANCSLHVAFATPEQRRAFELGHCKSWDYETACPLAKMHNERYEHEEPE